MSVAGPVILVVEDEPEMRRFIRASLESNGYRVQEADTVRLGRQLLQSHHPALLLLDLGLPDGDGIDFTRELRQTDATPIIVISARGREDDKVTALDAGANDYLTKPFGVNELLARMRVALRHAQAGPGSQLPVEYDFGELHIDVVRRVVSRAGAELRLTPTEYDLLLLFAKNAGKVLTHGTILREVWGPAYMTHTHYVRVHVAELRKKIEAEPARPKLLVTESGVGYRFREAAPAR